MIRPLVSLIFVAFAATAAVTEPVCRAAPIADDTTESWSYTDCGRPTDPIQLESIAVSPDPPKAGEDLTVTVRALVTEAVEEGAYAEVIVKLGRVKILTTTFDICEEARYDVSCPMRKGPHIVVHTVALPNDIPRAKFTVDINAYTVDDDDLMCLNLEADFMKKPFF
ncbi:ML domain-containing protein [Mucidula mucida]|nr:ML domain-containing protein [Mucidula mucida]